MAKSVNQKIKLLKIYDILRMNTDKEHPMGTNELIRQLKEAGIHCERKALASDIALLQKFGYQIETATHRQNRQNAYFLASRDLSLGATRFLIDATQSAAFLSEDQTQEIVEKLAALAGTNKKEVLEKNVLYFGKLKHSNGEVLGTITKLDRAIERRNKVSFEYHLFGVSGREAPKTDSIGRVKRYEAAPIALAYHGGYYYLLALLQGRDTISPFRIDRIRAVEIGKETFAPNKYVTQFKNGELKDSMSAFGMWVGEPKAVRIEFEAGDAGDIVDKFGPRVPIVTEKNGRYSACVKVNTDDPVFLGWCLSYGDKLEIVSPPEVREKLLRYAEQVCAVYAGPKNRA